MRWLATRLHGDGTETIVADELPIAGGTVQRSLSGPGGVSGAIPVEVARLTGDVLVAGVTGLYCLSDHGTVLGDGILTEDSGREGERYVLDAVGHAAYPAGMPYDGNDQWIQVDPADLIRHAWDHVQSQPRHNLGVTLDDTTTPVRVGTEEEDVSFETGSGERGDFT